MKIGVLAIQGDYEAHKARLEQLGAEVMLVRKPEQLDAIDGIIIPGGESSTFLNFLPSADFWKSCVILSLPNPRSALVPAQSCWRSKWKSSATIAQCNGHSHSAKCLRPAE